jgi:hypothetical protein
MSGAVVPKAGLQHFLAEFRTCNYLGTAFASITLTQISFSPTLRLLVGYGLLDKL